MEISLDMDQSVFVRAAIKNVTSEAVLASLLVSLMILLFLGSWRNTIVVITSIPCAMFAGIICLYLTGGTVNLMTLGGLALATGILVDDATVAVENIHRNRALGKPLTVAILDGSHEVALPRTMATLAICIVFFPVAFLFGVSKYLFTPLALAVVFSLLASYVLSFTLVLMLSRHLLAKEEHAHATHPPRGLGQHFNAWRERALEGCATYTAGYSPYQTVAPGGVKRNPGVRVDVGVRAPAGATETSRLQSFLPPFQGFVLPSPRLSGFGSASPGANV